MVFCVDFVGNLAGLRSWWKRAMEGNDQSQAEEWKKKKKKKLLLRRERHDLTLVLMIVKTSGMLLLASRLTHARR